MRRRAVLLSLLALAACPRTAGSRHVELLVIAPHPDDEILMAGGLMRRTIERGERVAVVLVTNGDATCARDAAVREAESVEALTAIGVSEVHFLGFPDGALELLGPEPLPPRAHRWPDGTCGVLDETWADGRRGFVDEARKRTGRPAKWTAPALETVLATLLEELDPNDVVVPHGIDDHPDHAMTYVFFRRALDLGSSAPTMVRRAVVHAGPTWPIGGKPFEPEAMMPALPAPLARYLPTDRMPIDARRKLDLIGRHRSQLDTTLEADWLSAFAKREELFFTERLRRHGHRWLQAGAKQLDADRTELDVNGFTETNTWGPAGFSAVTVRPSSSR